MQKYKVKKKYDSIYFNDDNVIALQLQKKVKENNKVKIIKIPTQKRDIKADSVCSVAGWGSLQTNGSASDRLMETKVYIMDNTECEIRWGDIYSVPKMMCTYGFGGFCHVCTKDDSQTLFIYEIV